MPTPVAALVSLQGADSGWNGTLDNREMGLKRPIQSVITTGAERLWLPVRLSVIEMNFESINSAALL